MAPAAFDAMHLISPLSSFDTRVIVNTPEIQFSRYDKICRKYFEMKTQKLLIVNVV